MIRDYLRLSGIIRDYPEMIRDDPEIIRDYLRLSQIIRDYHRLSSGYLVRASPVLCASTGSAMDSISDTI